MDVVLALKVAVCEPAHMHDKNANINGLHSGKFLKECFCCWPSKPDFVHSKQGKCPQIVLWTAEWMKPRLPCILIPIYTHMCIKCLGFSPLYHLFWSLHPLVNLSPVDNSYQNISWRGMNKTISVPELQDVTKRNKLACCLNSLTILNNYEKHSLWNSGANLHWPVLLLKQESAVSRVSIRLAECFYK